MLNTPFGKAEVSSSPMYSEVIGVIGEGFSTKLLPSVMAGAHFCTAQKIGKFQGVIPATTPIGFRTTFVWCVSAGQIRAEHKPKQTKASNAVSDHGVSGGMHICLQLM